jgi:hypothetical protein
MLIKWWVGRDTANALKISESLKGVIGSGVSELRFRKYLFLSMFVSIKNYARVRY